ncbi:MAG: alanine racemase, partial [Micromonosporaceae bacterium]
MAVQTMPSGSYRSSWCEIDLVRFRRNLGVLMRVAGTKFLLVVKANAYGHGISRMAAEAVSAGVDMLGVATIGEADLLLRDGIGAPLLIMCALDAEEIDYCVAHGVHFLAWRPDQFTRAYAAADRYRRKPRIHLEIDTGMSRSGVDVADFAGLLESLPPAQRAGVVGLTTHFFAADMQTTDSSEVQLKEYLECVRVAKALGLRPLLHVANSPGTIRMPASRLSLVRMGIAAYGLPPSEHTPLPPDVLPIMTWKANLTNVRTIEPGRGVGYGWRYVASDHEAVGTVAVGYADGFHRFPLGVN